MAIYRRYEDPRALERQRDSLKARIEEDKIVSEVEGRDPDIDLQIELAELEERINFAWQDEEFEEDERRRDRELYGYDSDIEPYDNEYSGEEEEYEL